MKVNWHNVWIPGIAMLITGIALVIGAAIDSSWPVFASWGFAVALGIATSKRWPVTTQGEK